VTDSFEPDRNTAVDEGYWVQQFLGSEYAPVYFPDVVRASQAQVVSVKAGTEVQADVLMRKSSRPWFSGGHGHWRDGWHLLIHRRMLPAKAGPLTQHS